MGEDILGEIKYRLHYNETNRTTSIILKCPKCKMEGRLVKGRLYEYKIIHNKKKCCIFGWTSQYYKELERIYREVRYK